SLEVVFEQAGKGAKPVLVDVCLDLHRLLPNNVASEHYDGQDPPLLEMDQVDVLERAMAGARSGHHADVVGGAGHRQGGALEDCLELGRQRLEELGQAVAYVDADRFLLHQEVDKVPIPQVRRHASRGRVGLTQVTGLHEEGQFVAYG